ncbi:MAG: hypothetical protein KKE84_07785 [Gammaproteobacteria bacterium]|nr:hypothetical protein [Gammaproteobacteria bacterium]
MTLPSCLYDSTGFFSVCAAMFIHMDFSPEKQAVVGQGRSWLFKVRKRRPEPVLHASRRPGARNGFSAPGVWLLRPPGRRRGSLSISRFRCSTYHARTGFALFFMGLSDMPGGGLSSLRRLKATSNRATQATHCKEWIFPVF